MGDYDDRYAEVAKKISMKQLRLALASGDPTNVSSVIRMFLVFGKRLFHAYSVSLTLTGFNLVVRR